MTIIEISPDHFLNLDQIQVVKPMLDGVEVQWVHGRRDVLVGPHAENLLRALEALSAGATYRTVEGG